MTVDPIIATIFAGLLSALLYWLGRTVQGLTVECARLEERINALERKLEDMG